MADPDHRLILDGAAEALTASQFHQHRSGELEHHAIETRDRLAPKLRLMRCAGVQDELIKFFGTTPRSRIAPLKPRTQPTAQLGRIAEEIVKVNQASSTNHRFCLLNHIHPTTIWRGWMQNSNVTWSMERVIDRVYQQPTVTFAPAPLWEQ